VESWWWNLNLAIHWVGSVQISLLGQMEWGFGRTSKGVKGCFQVTRFEVGDGAKVRLWHDLWCRDKALKEVFPNLYGIACAKDASVAAHLELFGGSNQWKVSFAGTTHYWEVDVFASFINLLFFFLINK
jgi:hypothetical protein